MNRCDSCYGWPDHERGCSVPQDNAVDEIIEVLASHGLTEKYTGPEAGELAPYFDRLKQEIKECLP